MATAYVTFITGALQVAFHSLSNQEAWGLARGGLVLYVADTSAEEHYSRYKWKT